MARRGIGRRATGNPWRKRSRAATLGVAAPCNTCCNVATASHVLQCCSSIATRVQCKGVRSGRSCGAQLAGMRGVRGPAAGRVPARAVPPRRSIVPGIDLLRGLRQTRGAPAVGESYVSAGRHARKDLRARRVRVVPRARASGWAGARACLHQQRQQGDRAKGARVELGRVHRPARRATRARVIRHGAAKSKAVGNERRWSTATALKRSNPLCGSAFGATLQHTLQQGESGMGRAGAARKRCARDWA